MVLTREQLLKMDTDALVDYALEANDLKRQIADLHEKVDSVEGIVKIISKANELLKQNNDKLVGKVTYLERELTRTAQYPLNRQIEVHHVPTSIPQDALAEKMCEFFSLTGVEVQPRHLDKCHRLKRETSVICEFKDRSTRDPILLGRKNLKNKKTELANLDMTQFVLSESLCHSFKKLDFLCRQLKKHEKIMDTWFFNGKLFINHDGSKKQICHINELYELFGVETIDGYSTRA